VKEWIAMGNIFPDGLDYVYNQTEWPIQGHNRYWAIDNVYAQQNGGWLLGRLWLNAVSDILRRAV
jgi:hypothetical protein